VRAIGWGGRRVPSPPRLVRFWDPVSVRLSSGLLDNGGGPCYSANAFHAYDLGGASVCAMGAIEEGFSAEDVFSTCLIAWWTCGDVRAAQRGIAADGRSGFDGVCGAIYRPSLEPWEEHHGR
jgi:hypothetical protein